jgi:chromate transporter
MTPSKSSSFSLLQLFFQLFRVSALTLGGGYSMIVVLEEFYVKSRKLLTMEEWEEYLIVSQTSPGAFAVNLSYLIGFHLYGVRGAIVAIAGMVLPALGVMLVVGSVLLEFIHYPLMRSFLLGVACGPIAYYSYAFWRMAKSAFRKLWILGAFVAYTTLQLVFQVPVTWVIALSFGVILLQALWLLFKRPPRDKSPSDPSNPQEDTCS